MSERKSFKPGDWVHWKPKVHGGALWDTDRAYRVIAIEDGSLILAGFTYSGGWAIENARFATQEEIDAVPFAVGDIASLGGGNSLTIVTEDNALVGTTRLDWHNWQHARPAEWRAMLPGMTGRCSEPAQTSSPIEPSCGLEDSRDDWGGPALAEVMASVAALYDRIGALESEPAAEAGVLWRERVSKKVVGFRVDSGCVPGTERYSLTGGTGDVSECWPVALEPVPAVETREPWTLAGAVEHEQQRDKARDDGWRKGWDEGSAHARKWGNRLTFSALCFASLVGAALPALVWAAL